MIENNLIDRLKKRIEIQEKSILEDGFGGFIENWKTLFEIWAEIKPISMFEDYEANKIDEKISHIITARYSSTIKNENRIKYKNRIFNIKGMINCLEKNKILQIKVEEIIQTQYNHNLFTDI